jgi:hypothetical protein
MKEDDVKAHLGRILDVAAKSETSEVLRTLAEFMSDYYQRQSDEALCKMNYCVMILMIKQGLVDPKKMEQQVSFVIRQEDLMDTIKHIGS